MSLTISERLRREYWKGRRVYTLDYIFPFIDKIVMEVREKISKEKYYQVVKMLKYLKKSHFYRRIPADLYYDVVGDIIAEVLEKKIIDPRVLMFKLKRKYIPNYISQIHSKSETWGEWVFHALGEEYFPKGATGYKTVSLYLPEGVYHLLEKTQSRSKSIQVIIDLLYDTYENLVIDDNHDLKSLGKKRKGSVKLPLEYYWKLSIMVRKTGASVNQLILHGISKFIEYNMRN